MDKVIITSGGIGNNINSCVSSTDVYHCTIMFSSRYIFSSLWSVYLSVLLLTLRESCLGESVLAYCVQALLASFQPKYPNEGLS